MGEENTIRPSFLEEKWGHKALSHGWTAVPNTLVRGMSELGIDPTSLAILLYLSVFWWESEKLPYPSIQRMSKEIGVSSKTIERKLSQMEKNRILVRKKITGGATQYDMTPLLRLLPK